MAWDVRIWNLGVVGLVAGCGSVVPDADGSGSQSTGSESSSSGTQPTSDAPTSGPPPQCSVDSDCPPAFECRDGACEYAPYCSTCCEDDCYDPDSGSGSGGYECSDDYGCFDGGICIDHVCVDGAALPECADGALTVEPLPIPMGGSWSNLAFVHDPANAGDRLVLVSDENVAVVAADGTPAWTDAPSTSQSPRRILVADFDNDGDEDVALTGERQGEIGIATYRIGDTPTFMAFSAAAGESPLLGDFDGDGNVDVLQYDPAQGLVASPGLGNGAFESPIAIGLAVDEAFAADIDSDGNDELFLGNGMGVSFGPAFDVAPFVDLATAEPDLMIAALVMGDVDGDGTREVFTMRGYPQTWIERNDSSGTLVTSMLVTTASAPGTLVDLAGDGMLGLALHGAVVRSPAADACVLTYAPPGTVRQIAAGDWDGDGREELAIQNESTWDFARVRLPVP
jgi:hypothetical protein